MHLSVAIRGLTPGTYGVIAWDLPTFVANFWPGTGYIALYSKHTQAEETVCSLKLPFCDLHFCVQNTGGLAIFA